MKVIKQNHAKQHSSVSVNLSLSVSPGLGSTESVRVCLSIVLGTSLHAARVTAMIRLSQTKCTNQLSAC